MSTFNRIREIIASTLGVEKDSITENLEMEDIPEWDSMGNMAIIAALEEKLGVEFPIEDLFELNSVRAIVAEIEKLNK